MLEVEIFISSVDDFEGSSAFFIETDGGEDEVGLAEENLREASRCPGRDVEIGLGDVEFCLVNEKVQIFPIFSWHIVDEVDFNRLSFHA